MDKIDVVMFDRRKRLFELREAVKVARFGSVVPISVSQAPPDVWVVVIQMWTGLLMQCLEDLATKYPATKFVKIISTDCIPNYPDRNLPTLLVYNSGAVKANHVGMRSFGRRCTPESANGRSREAVIEGVRIEKVVTQHEDKDDGCSSD
ncbi:hypothetical protein ACLB2K_076921 [Fragaria x ananassa]